MRVDLILTDRRCYTYEAYAARYAVQYFEHHQVPYSRIYLSDGVLQDYLVHIQEEPPKWTLSFCNVTPHYKPLCDVLRIPHFFWLQDTFAHAVHFLNSDFGKVGIHDPILCQKLDASNVVLLGQGVQNTCSYSDAKMFDTVLFADLIDCTFLEKTWEELLTGNEIITVKKAIQQKDPVSAIPYFLYVEQYLRAKNTLQIVTNFKNVKLHVFGEHAGNNWLVRLPANIHLHTALPYTEHFEVLKSSKIALMDPHNPWYLPALAAGCLPLKPNEQRVRYFLDHPAEREHLVSRLQHQCLEQTWEKQMNKLMEYMR